ncbi:hypothetical protein BY458DRAFT_518571 [Sporodiniella umbellata]|nr:hypothetical protein BY458DRAFT_518571 [Sporodiniella umbellata]
MSNENPTHETPATEHNPVNDLNLEDSQLQQVLAQAAVIMGDYSQLLASMDVNKFPSASLLSKPNPVLPDAETYKKLLLTQKVRQDNRERKKRWRERNQERNKDNDLRCRVNKRAQKLFGREESEHKKKWTEEEFARRREKRMGKEQRKGLPNLADENTPPLSPSPMKNDEEVAAFTNLLSDQNYISILADNLNSLASTQDKPNQLTTQLIEFLQQQQGTILGQEEVNENSEQKENDKPENKTSDYPMEVVLTLMQMNAGWRQ